MAKALTQSQVVATLADAAEISKKQAKLALETLQIAIVKNDKVATPFGIFTKKVKPARPARKGVNPFTGEPATFKARPKTTVVKYRPNKATKEAVSK
jgi:DNA-binding protein HU-beta